MDLARELWGTNGPFVSSSAASLMDVSWPPAAPQSRGKPRAQHGAEIRALAFLGGRGARLVLVKTVMFISNGSLGNSTQFMKPLL